MMEERYHATTQNRFYPHMSNANKNITVEAKLISPPMYNFLFSQKVLARKFPPGSPMGHLWRETPTYRAFYIYLYVYIYLYLKRP